METSVPDGSLAAHNNRTEILWILLPLPRDWMKHNSSSFSTVVVCSQKNTICMPPPPHSFHHTTKYSRLMHRTMTILMDSLAATDVPVIVRDDNHTDDNAYAVFVIPRVKYVCTVTCLTTSLHYHVPENKIVCPRMIDDHPEIPCVATYHTPEAAMAVYVGLVVDVMCNRLRRHRAARTIQRAWRRAISDPVFGACRNRLTRELHVLNDVVSTIVVSTIATTSRIHDVTPVDDGRQNVVRVKHSDVRSVNRKHP